MVICLSKKKKRGKLFMVLIDPARPRRRWRTHD
jgi:hypothetical protein